jgi:hypothetical protein
MTKGKSNSAWPIARRTLIAGAAAGRIAGSSAL